MNTRCQGYKFANFHASAPINRTRLSAGSVFLLFGVLGLANRNQIAFLNPMKDGEQLGIADRSQLIGQPVERLHGLVVKDAHIAKGIKAFMDSGEGTVQAAQQFIDVWFVGSGRIRFSHGSPRYQVNFG
jgi:hypothetical protein